MTDRSVLYITYDGVLEPLGESQVLAYLVRLAAGFEIALLSFEKREDLLDRRRVEATEQRLADHGIEWIRLQYHKWPGVISTALDAGVGIVVGRAVCRRRDVSIVHARGYLPSLIALGVRGASGAKYLFDMRGFWVDEKVSAGHWRAGSLLQRVGKYWERRFLKEADAVVSLTEAGVRELPRLGYDASVQRPVSVIPTCVDLGHFAPVERDAELALSLGLAGFKVVGCVGTMSNWYLRRDMLHYLGLLTRALPTLRILVVTRENHAVLRRDALTAGIDDGRLVVTAASYDQMPRLMSMIDIGLFFIRPTFAKRASAATKLAEFLAMGVPVILNDGVGDSGAHVKARDVGVVLSNLDDASLEASVAMVRKVLDDPGIKSRCRQAAMDLFDVDLGASRYRGLYERLSALA